MATMCTLKEKREDLKKEWENCFEMRIEEKLNEKGIEKFWDDATTLKEAENLLTEAAFDMLLEDTIGGFIGDIIGNVGKNAKVIVLAGGCPDFEPCNGEEKKEGAAAKKFAVLEKEDNHVYPDRFETADEAYDFIRGICMETTHTFNDFSVVEEM